MARIRSRRKRKIIGELKKKRKAINEFLNWINHVDQLCLDKYIY